jgi:hypothetical protein
VNVGQSDEGATVSNGDTVSVTATILGSTIVSIPDVPWTSGMNAQQALEGAYNQREDPHYGFSLEYYGYDSGGHLLGYLVEEIDQIGDQPGVYWEFLVNDAPSSTGIDTTILNGGDAVSFVYQYYNPNATPASPQLAAKHERKTGLKQVH